MTKKNDLIKKVVDGIFARHNKDVDAPLNKKSEAKIEVEIQIDRLDIGDINTFAHGISSEKVSASQLKEAAIEAVMAGWEAEYGEKAAIAPAKKVAPPPPPRRPDVKPVASASSRAAPPVPVASAKKPPPPSWSKEEEFVAKMVGLIFQINDGNRAMKSKAYRELDKEDNVQDVLKTALISRAEEARILKDGLKSVSGNVTGADLNRQVINSAIARWAVEHPKAAITPAKTMSANGVKPLPPPRVVGSKSDPKPRSDSTGSDSYKLL